MPSGAPQLSGFLCLRPAWVLLQASVRQQPTMLGRSLSLTTTLWALGQQPSVPRVLLWSRGWWGALLLVFESGLVVEGFYRVSVLVSGGWAKKRYVSQAHRMKKHISTKDCFNSAFFFFWRGALGVFWLGFFCFFFDWFGLVFWGSFCLVLFCLFSFLFLFLLKLFGFFFLKDQI